MSIIDPLRNFADCPLIGLYDQFAVTINVAPGYGAILPDPSVDGAFNMIWWNSTDFAAPSLDPLKEWVRVTAIPLADTLTILRAQAGTIATPKNLAGKTYMLSLNYSRLLHDQVRASRTVFIDAVMPAASPSFVNEVVIDLPWLTSEYGCQPAWGLNDVDDNTADYSKPNSSLYVSSQSPGHLVIRSSGVEESARRITVAITKK